MCGLKTVPTFAAIVATAVAASVIISVIFILLSYLL
jgi:hypothetical protein